MTYMEDFAAGNQETPVKPPAQTGHAINPDDITSCIQAILFAAGHPVPYETLSRVIGLPESQIREIVALMAQTNAASASGLVLLTFPDTCQLATREIYAPYIREALGIKRGGNLSNASLEVLAIVAYQQPVARSYVDAIRGVDSSYAVSSLLDKQLIMPVGRLDAPGRPILYGTTDKFLRVFGFSGLDELPITEPLTPPTQEGDEQPG